MGKSILNKIIREKSSIQIAAYSYFPLIGWIIPLYFRKEDYFCKHHARQGFLIAVIFILAAVFLNVTNIMIFTLQIWEEFRVGLIAAIYALYLIYLIICIANTLLTSQGKIFYFPLIKYFTPLIEL